MLMCKYLGNGTLSWACRVIGGDEEDYGTAVDFIPTANPWIMQVPAPVLAVCASISGIGPDRINPPEIKPLDLIH